MQAAFSFQGMELVAMQVSRTIFARKLCWYHHLYSAAAETESPRRNITKAMRRVLLRIITFYVSILMASPAVF